MTRSLCFHVIESKQPGTIHYVWEPKEGPFMEYLRKKPLFKYSLVRIQVRGSCNGLICLSQDDSHVITSLVVIHPLRKECYELPPFPLCLGNDMRRVSCGLGFDAFTNTYKMVCVLLKEYAPPNKPDMVKKNLCTMVNVFGTNSWREIPQVPSYPITGKAVFANGCLHWLVSHLDIKTKDGRREVWVMNKQKEWVPHCRFEKQTVPDGYIDVIGCWNKDGDILIKCMMRGDGSSLMDRLPSNIILDIFSRVPIKYLARSRLYRKIFTTKSYNSLAVIHPLRKECYELPSFPLRFENHMRRESCGLGFDSFTNTYKMVCVLLKEYAPPDKPDICHFDIKFEDGGREVICFDVNKEEFGLMDPPKRMCDL
nr:hypothetical protein [Tanacetum cinerariifolium]